MKPLLASIKDAYNEIEKFPKVLVWLIILGPIIDIVTSVGKREFNVDLSLGILIKGIFLAYVAIKLLLSSTPSKEDKLIKSALIAIMVYGGFHLFLVFFYYGRGYAVGAAVTFAKTFYMPVLLLGLMKSMKKRDVKWIRSAMMIAALIIMGSMALSVITGTEYSAYKYNKLGTVGWFFAANEVSAFIGILTPIVLYYILYKLKINTVLKAVILGAYIYLYYQIGTKVVGLSILLVSLFSLGTVLVLKLKNKEMKVVRQVIILTVTFVMGAGLIPVTPVGYNMNVHFDLIKDIPNPSQEEPTESEDNFEEGFDMDKVLINNPKMLSFIFSGRDRYFAVRRYLYEEADTVQKVFGLSQFSPNDEGVVNSYIIEIDFLDIYFNYGIVGFLLYWGIIAAVLGISLFRILKGKILFKEDGILMFYLCAILLSVGIAMFAGHVYVSPSVSIYIALYLSLLYKESEPTRELEQNLGVI